MSICDRRGNLEVEVIRGRQFQLRPGSKILPGNYYLFDFNQLTNFNPSLFIDFKFLAPYVKVYLVKGGKCIAKAKTTISRRTLDPLYQQQLIFNEDYRGCILQVIINSSVF